MTKRAFASVMQAVMIVILLLSLVLIAQQISIRVYQIGFVMLVAATFLQIGFGNIPSEAGLWRSMKLLGIVLFILAAVFSLGIFVAPYLIKLARG
ncbi:MAG: hypothetical protein ACOC7U_09210 [Spirochaetota bacterium]